MRQLLPLVFFFMAALRICAADITATLDSSDGSSGFIFKDSSATEVGYIDSDGNLTIKGGLRLDAGGVKCATAEMLIVDGRVGIGTTNPEVALQVDSGIVSFTSQSAVSVVCNTSFTSILGATKIPFSQEIYDRQNEYDPVVNYRFTAQATGDYLVCACLYAPNVGVYELDLHINGVREKGFAGSSNYAGGYASGSRVTHLTAGDYLEIWMYQGVGALAVNINSIHNWMTINKIN
ncbi:MAG: hypothetical protein PHQ23_06295 [Candidatus Wallbacteria bacterium]|nr:hypothetical protein [Candidatus Wallbacteria bacterium]